MAPSLSSRRITALIGQYFPDTWNVGADSRNYRFDDPSGKQLGLTRADNGNPKGM
jgi:hypothetical protein